MQHTENNATANPEKSKCAAWLWPFFLVLIGAIGLACILRSCNLKAGDGMLALTAQSAHETHGGEATEHEEHGEAAEEHAEKPAVTGHLNAQTGDFEYELGNMTDLKLPNETVLKVAENSTEAKLVHFLSDEHAAMDPKGNWFDCTSVNFKTGGSELTEASAEQLKNLASIIKAFPSATFKLGGYTDNSGSKEANVKISQQRAEKVMAMLQSLGVDAKSITGAEGYGPEFPVASNETAEGKAQNRRVSVNVKSK